MRPGSRLAAVAIAGGLLVTAPFAAAQADVSRALVAGTSAPSGVTAKGAELYDVGAHKALWSRAAGTERPIGSITKVMTALLVLRAGHLNRTLTVQKSWVTYATKGGFSNAGLKAGDRLTVRQLLSAMMLPSGCDAAYGLAASLYGGGTKFVAKMNTTAKSLGLNHTRYVDFDGTPLPKGGNGYSTPADQIKLALVAMGNATFRSVVDENTYNVAAAPATTRTSGRIPTIFSTPVAATAIAARSGSRPGRPPRQGTAFSSRHDAASGRCTA